MRKHVLLYGLLCGVLIAAPQLMEYRWLVLENSVDIYVALVGTLLFQRHQISCAIKLRPIP